MLGDFLAIFLLLIFSLIQLWSKNMPFKMAVLLNWSRSVLWPECDLSSECPCKLKNTSSAAIEWSTLNFKTNKQELNLNII